MHHPLDSKQPLISVIIPTKNSAPFLDACLASVRGQTYPHIEIIVVDNHSTDTTQEIARRYTKHVFVQGPERSAQTNYGVEQAKGQYIYKVDSDFVLDPDVITQAVAKLHEGFDAVVVHNTPDASVSWLAKIRKFEIDMYKYDLSNSVARIVSKAIYQKIGGLNPYIIFGEDYDFQNRLNKHGYKTGFIDAEAIHLGEPTNFWSHMKKFYFYGKDFINYQRHNPTEARKQVAFFRGPYWNHRADFLRRPLMGLAFLGYNLSKYAAGGMGYVSGALTRSLHKGRKSTS